MDGLKATLQRKDTSGNSQIYDLGIVSEISVTYSSACINSPVIIWGYTGSFTMDTKGVSCMVRLSYNRISPDDPSTGSDSTKWSNSYWKKKIKDELNSWQAEHEGYILKLTSPDTELYPSAEYIGFVQSMPLSHDSNSLNKLTGQIEFVLGRLTYT